jgi:predicted phosphodiesterase
LRTRLRLENAADPGRKSLAFRRELLLSVLVGILVAYFGPGLLPAVEGKVGPARMALRADAGSDGTVVGLPPLGTVRAQTHAIPLNVELQLVEVEVERLARALTSTAGREDLRIAVAADLRTLALRAAAQFGVLLAVLALGVGALLLGRRRLALIVTPVTALLLVGAGLLSISITYDTDAFEEPEFTGSLTKAQVVVDAVARGADVLDEARSRFDIAGDRLGRLMSLLAIPNVDPREAEVVLLHVSDIHANPIGFEIVRELAERFDVDAVVDTGDLGSAELDTGEITTLIDPVDRLIAREIAAVGVSYLYIPGNHDSPQLRAAVGRAPNVTILDGETVSVGAVDIFGWADPTFSTRPIPESAKSQIRAAESADLAEEVTLQRPDVIAVHDSILAGEAIGAAPLVLAGHTHERAESLDEGTLVLTVGSTGATGLKSVTIEADRAYEAQILYIEDGRLVALDYVALEGVGGDFELERRTYAHPLDEP